MRNIDSVSFLLASSQYCRKSIFPTTFFVIFAPIRQLQMCRFNFGSFYPTDIHVCVSPTRSRLLSLWFCVLLTPRNEITHCCSSCILMFQLSWVIWVFFMIFIYSCKEYHTIMMSMELNLQINFDNIAISIDLVLLNGEHRRVSHLL